MKKMLTICCVFLLCAAVGFADESLVVGVVNKWVCENFNRFAGSHETMPAGFGVSSNGVIMMKQGDSGFKGSSTGGVQVAGCYAWGIGIGDSAFGCQPVAGRFAPGFFQVVASNNTGRSIRSVSVSFEAVCLNNENRASSIELRQSTDGVQFTAIPGVKFVSPVIDDGSNVWSRTVYSCKMWINGSLAPGKRLWLRWWLDDVGGSGSRDEYGIDNFGIFFHELDGTVITIR